jgi:hypothetical protein
MVQQVLKNEAGVPRPPGPISVRKPDQAGQPQMRRARISSATRRAALGSTARRLDVQFPEAPVLAEFGSTSAGNKHNGLFTCHRDIKVTSDG